MRLLQFLLVFSALISSSAVFAQARLAFGGISGGGGVDGVAELVGMEGNVPLVRCPDQNVYRCDVRCKIGLSGDLTTQLQLFCLEAQNSF
jgi:hypothetical protein